MTFYKVKSLFVPIMSDATTSSKRLGIFLKGRRVNVISITDEWAYCNYHNKKAYIKLSNLKESLTNYVNLTIKYIDETTLEALTEPSYYTNLKFGEYTYYPILISGYTLLGNFPILVSITKDNPTQLITFKYKKALGSIIIKYIDESTLEPLVEGSIYNNVELATYSYYPIQIDGYSLDDSPVKKMTLTESNLNEVITFKYKKN